MALHEKSVLPLSRLQIPETLSNFRFSCLARSSPARNKGNQSKYPLCLVRKKCILCLNYADISFLPQTRNLCILLSVMVSEPTARRAAEDMQRTLFCSLPTQGTLRNAVCVSASTCRDWLLPQTVCSLTGYADIRWPGRSSCGCRSSMIRNATPL